MDKQQIEICGRARVVEELMKAGIEVAMPLRDKGVDLLAYPDSLKESPDGSLPLPSFTATPIQLKAATKQSFGVWQKYQRIPGLVVVFAWHIFEPAATQFYALTQAESEAIGQEMDWFKPTNTSWHQKGYWDTTYIGKKLLELLKPHRLNNAAAWRAKLTPALVADALL